MRRVLSDLSALVVVAFGVAALIVGVALFAFWIAGAPLGERSRQFVAAFAAVAGLVAAFLVAADTWSRR